MIIVIDGYNFLKTVLGTKFVTDDQMRHWMSLFSKYVDQRGNQVLVVFDAGPSFFETREPYGNIDIIYAGQHQSADDVIKRWMSQNQSKDVLLVSSDRAIRDCADRLQLVSVASDDFHRVFIDVMAYESRQAKVLMHTICKTTQDAGEDVGLDVLMEQGSRNLVQAAHKKEYASDIRIRDGKKASKVDKLVMKKIHKI